MMTMCILLKHGLLVLSYVCFVVFVIGGNENSSLVLKK